MPHYTYTTCLVGILCCIHLSPVIGCWNIINLNETDWLWKFITRNVTRSIYVLYRHLPKWEDEKNDSRYIVPGWAKKTETTILTILSYQSLLDMTSKFQPFHAMVYCNQYILGIVNWHWQIQPKKCSTIIYGKKCYFVNSQMNEKTACKCLIFVTFPLFALIWK